MIMKKELQPKMLALNAQVMVAQKDLYLQNQQVMEMHLLQCNKILVIK